MGSKLDAKLKSGEIKESELMEEASELMSKMKDMPGMKNMESMLSKMGLPTGGKNSKVSMNQFQAHMKSNIAKAKQRERMLRKLEERKRRREQQNKTNTQYTTTSWSGTNEKMEKTGRNANPKKNNKKKKKKKNRKKKN